MTNTQPNMPPRSAHKTIFWITTILISVIVVSFGAIAAVDLFRPTPQGAADETPVASSVSGPDNDHRRSMYSFGHTSSAMFLQAAAPQVLEQRLPFALGVTPQAFRVRVNNIDYLNDTRLGDIEIQSMYLGSMGDDGTFEHAVRLTEGAQTRNSGYTSDWFDASTFEIAPEKTYLLGISFSVPTKTQVGVAPGVGWLRSGLENGPLTAPENLGEFNRAGTYLDISIDYAFDDETAPTIAVFGHSLNAGAIQNPDIPHRGETSAWHQVWARQEHGAAASFAAAGAWTANFMSGSPKWNQASELDVDYVAVWASSSDLVSGTPLDDVGSYWVALIDEAKHQWPDAKIVGFTEPPRGANGSGERLRLQWNDFLRAEPEQIDFLVDADALLADPEDPSTLSPKFDGDGSHFSPNGHELIAEAFAEALGEPWKVQP